MNRLHNCPNCGGYINDHGRCEFCGSKVYDLCDINLALDPTKSPDKTYLRIKTDKGIWTVPVYADCMSVDTPASYMESTLGLPHNHIPVPTYPEINIHFYTVGEGTYENE